MDRQTVEYGYIDSTVGADQEHIILCWVWHESLCLLRTFLEINKHDAEVRFR